ncbi:MAG: hypothetical protein WDN75_10775 [Bacteroidota bacterium]
MELLDTEIGKTLLELFAHRKSFLRMNIFIFLRKHFEKSSVITTIRSHYYYHYSTIPSQYSSSVKTSKQERRDGIAYALELMDLFVDQEMKPKLFPLLTISP